MNGLIGRTLGGYQILSQIGRGGMASVFRAYQPSLERHVAIKVLPPFYAEQDETFVRRFKQEARAVANLRHPNILMVMDHGEEAGLAYIVMEFVEAGTLAELLGEPMEYRQMATLLGQTASALDYAHGLGVVHRDIKPSNILLPKPDWPLLTDFGLAKVVGGTRLTQSGTIAGTPAYMSPEQGRGEAVDFRSDIYSLGIVLYEMATGAVPYEAETPMAVVVKHIIEPLPLPRSRNPQLPESIELVLLKALAKDPADRYGRANDFGEALRTAVAQLEAAAQPRQDRQPAPSPSPDPAQAPPVERATLLADAQAIPSAAHAGVAPPASIRSAVPSAADGVAPARVAAALRGVPRVAWAAGLLVVFGIVGLAIATTRRGPLSSAEISSTAPEAGAQAPGAPLPRTQRTLQQLLADGRAKMEAGDPAGALVDFQAAIDMVPGSVDVLLELARAQFALGDHEAALGSLARARATGSEDFGVQESVGWALYEMGFYPQAAEAFERAIELEPSAIWLYEGLASLYLEIGNLDAAQETARRALAAGADRDPDVLVSLAWNFIDWGVLEQAEPILALLAERYPDRPDGPRGTAEIHYRRGDLSGAIATLQTLVSRLPDRDAYEALGWWLWEAGESTAAEDAFRHAIQLDPAQATSAYGGLADLLLELGRSAEAEELLRGAVRGHPEQADLQAALGDLLAWSMGRYAEALPFYEAALELDPGNGWRYADLAEVHIALGAPDPAPALLEQAAAHAPDDPWLADSIGWAYLDLGQCESAVQHFQRALALDASIVTSAEGLRTCAG